ncbi:MAG TPA: alanine racemase [Qipengyuania sp.]|nr:alanine racemase [Qipengyuania sp.]
MIQPNSTTTTPSLLLDADKLNRNLARMQTHLAGLSVPLRPHVKTAKCVEIARRAIEGQPCGITVSTLAEARYFASHGFTDILYAVGISPIKFAEAAELRAGGIDLTLLLDSEQQAAALVEYSRDHGVLLPTLIEIDSDGHRAGLRPDDPALIRTAEILVGPGPEGFRGVLTHAGGSYDCTDVRCLREAARTERAALVEAAASLEQSGIACPVRSAGSTPTALFSDSAEGLTEIRAGVYMFMDLVMAGLGVCDLDDIAVSVLTSVIGHQRDKGWMIVDAGWMAMSRDRGTAKQAIDQGYGLVCDEHGRPLDDFIMMSANQEHGIITARDPSRIQPPDLPVGTLLRILPNHACATAAQHAGYEVIIDGKRAARWERMGGW